MNEYLKEIAILCGIEKHLSSHIARHTFATTVTLLIGAPIESITHPTKVALKIIEHPTKVKPFWVLLVLAFYMFLSMIYILLWFEIHLADVTDWNFFKSQELQPS